METKIAVIIVVLLVIIVVCLILTILSKKQVKPVMVDDSIFDLFEPNNIISVEFIRNKLVVSFNDASLFNVNRLKEYGGKGISVIGDKIKFFVSDKSQENEKLFNDLMKRIER